MVKNTLRRGNPNFQLPPGILAYVLHGGQIPGLSPETLDKITKEYIKRTYAAAETAKRAKFVTTESRYLSSPETIPQILTTQVIQEVDVSYPDRRDIQNKQVG